MYNNYYISRFGIKLWAICSSIGATLHVEPYCGTSTQLSKFGLGQVHTTSNIVM